MVARITLVYRPEHPEADEFGHVTKEQAMEWDYYNNPDNRAIIGNRIVELNFISDIMPETRHMINGKYYTSKAEFRKITKAAGCIEYGNDTKYLTTPRKPKELDRKQRRDDIKKAIHELKNNRENKNL